MVFFSAVRRLTMKLQRLETLSSFRQSASERTDFSAIISNIFWRQCPKGPKHPHLRGHCASPRNQLTSPCPLTVKPAFCLRMRHVRGGSHENSSLRNYRVLFRNWTSWRWRHDAVTSWRWRHASSSSSWCEWRSCHERSSPGTAACEVPSLSEPSCSICLVKLHIEFLLFPCHLVVLGLLRPLQRVPLTVTIPDHSHYSR